MTQELKAARANANRFQFGTAEWEAAMVVVRQLVRQVNDAAPKFAHTSIDGDVWSV